MKDPCDRLPELLVAEPPATLDALVLERALLAFQRCAAVASCARPSGDVESPARDRALGQPEPCQFLSPVRS
ncbi:MAG: hypothetical protein ABW217_16910 [Polyangiaceae bacterium]